MEQPSIVEQYLLLGLRLGRHVDGFVDAYFGPESLAATVAAEPPMAPGALVAAADGLLRDLDDGVDADRVEAGRRRWLRAQTAGLRTSASILAGEPIAYADEVERCYGVRPRVRDTDEFAEAHRRLAAVLPGDGPVRDRLVAWRESTAIPVDRLDGVLRSIAEDFRARTDRQFGLPEGEHVEWELATDQPWSGFNYYAGGLRSRVAINVDLPVLATSIGHLVAHEAYPGHHTEHTRKEAGLVRARGWMEETIFCVGTPQCLVAEGLADTALSVVAGDEADEVVADHLRAAGLDYDAGLATEVRGATTSLEGVRGNAAWMLHAEGRSTDEVVDFLERWGLLPRNRAEKSIQFLTSPTWRAYVTCYVEGHPLCRDWVAGDPARFEVLLTEQMLPADLMV